MRRAYGNVVLGPDLGEVFSKPLTEAEIRKGVREYRNFRAREESPEDLLPPMIQCPDCGRLVVPDILGDGPWMRALRYTCNGVRECPTCGGEMECDFCDYRPRCFGKWPHCIAAKCEFEKSCRKNPAEARRPALPVGNLDLELPESEGR